MPLKEPFRARLEKSEIMPEYNLAEAGDITAFSKLAPGVTLSTFTSSEGCKITFNGMSTARKKKIALNLFPQGEIINSVRNQPTLATYHDIVCVEGLYKKETTEKLTPNGLLDKATKGQYAAYQAINMQGAADNNKTFSMAEHIKDHCLFDELILSYTTVDPNRKDVDCRIIVTMPNITTLPVPKASFRRKVKTEFNYIPIANGALVGMHSLSPSMLYSLEAQKASLEGDEPEGG